VRRGSANMPALQSRAARVGASHTHTHTYTHTQTHNTHTAQLCLERIVHVLCRRKQVVFMFRDIRALTSVIQARANGQDVDITMLFTPQDPPKQCTKCCGSRFRWLRMITIHVRAAFACVCKCTRGFGLCDMLRLFFFFLQMNWRPWVWNTHAQQTIFPVR
jgi:hypothetical protein